MEVLSEKVAILISLFFLQEVNVNAHKHSHDRFPYEFEFGTCTSAYQVEGAWNIDGKGWSMWDYYIHTKPGIVEDGTNPDDAAKSYYLYKRDVEMLKELGVDDYRFSISWPRILPYGRGYINPQGVAYYNNLINELLANGITPFVTMYHWDLPENLSEQGGWLNEEIVDWFGDYVRILYKLFGDRVKNWMTINEPFIHCYFSYATGDHPPFVLSPGVGFYECGRNALLASARAYHIYKDEFKAKQKGQIGFVTTMEWGLPASNSSDDIQATLDYAAYHIDYFIHPIFSEEGNYPQLLIDKVAEASRREGLNSSRLRPFSPKEVEYIKGTADFMGVNHYVTMYIYRNSSLEGRWPIPSIDNDNYIGTYRGPSWPYYRWGHEYAPGLYHLLIYLRDKYNDPVIYITENGIPSEAGLNDDTRVNYYRNYLSVVLDALRDGVDIRGYFAWSLMDNFEWAFGYSMRFGFYEVNMTDENRTRTPKKSAFVFKEIIRSRVIDRNYNPDQFAMTNITDAAVTLNGTYLAFVIVIFCYLLKL